MDKLTNRQLEGIAELVHHIHDKGAIQCILEALGEENWTRGILSNSYHYLTNEQKAIAESKGGHYTSEEIDEHLDNYDINRGIAEKIERMGLTNFSNYSLEFADYLDEIREGKIICEGIDVEEIKNTICD